MTVILILGLVFRLPKYVSIVSSAERLVERQRKNAKWMYIRTKTRAAKVALRKAEALAVIKFKYGPFFCITEDLAMDYMYTLTQKVTDAILTFDFR